MIRLRRGSPPPQLLRHAARWAAELQAAIQQHTLAHVPDKHWNKYNKLYVKQALGEMSHDKCVYCESKLSHVSYPHIEHYRPKTHYPHLTFEWSNLLLACGICNGKEHKGDKFPLKEDDEQQPLLLNPCEDEPRDHLTFEEARVVPLTERGSATSEIMGLNRDDLFDRRRERLRYIDFIHRAIEQGALAATRRTEGEHILREAGAEEAEYSGMIQQFLAAPLPEEPPL